MYSNTRIYKVKQYRRLHVSQGQVSLLGEKRDVADLCLFLGVGGQPSIIVYSEVVVKSLSRV